MSCGPADVAEYEQKAAKARYWPVSNASVFNMVQTKLNRIVQGRQKAPKSFTAASDLELLQEHKAAAQIIDGSDAEADADSDVPDSQPLAAQAAPDQEMPGEGKRRSQQKSNSGGSRAASVPVLVPVPAPAPARPQPLTTLKQHDHGSPDQTGKFHYPKMLLLSRALDLCQLL